MRLKRARSLVITLEGKQPVLHNYLSKQRFTANGTGIDLLAAMDDWQTAEALMENLPYTPDSIRTMLAELLKCGAIVIEGSAEAAQDAELAAHWRWGDVAAFYQFSMRDTAFLEKEEQTERMQAYAETSPSPPLLTGNEGLDRVALPAFDPYDDFYNTLYQRRSIRAYSGEAIPLATLADCLFAGNGLKEIQDSGVYGQLPKTMTPSGGARNPYELFVYARNVAGLAPGFYHYSAAEHDLGHLPGRDLPEPSLLLGTQRWADKAAAIIFMAANFERTAWKYRQPLAFRVVLMETGYIAQNIQLVATRRGIGAAPTGALSESEIESRLGIDFIRQAAIFAVVLGAPEADPALT